MARKSSLQSIRQVLGCSRWLNNDISSLLRLEEQLEATALFSHPYSSEKGKKLFQNKGTVLDEIMRQPLKQDGCRSGSVATHFIDQETQGCHLFHSMPQSRCRGRFQYSKFHTNPSKQENEDQKKAAGLVDAFRPYMHLSRMDKPIGTWLLAWPSFWSISMAAPAGGPIDIQMLGIFGLGAFLLRGAGCTINDMWDRDFDKKVERTKSRPLAAGTLTQVHALGWLGLQLSAGLCILMQLQPYSQLIGAASLPFVATYPLMKRVTGWPQAFLGLTINWGAIMGWAAVHNSLNWNVVGPLYMSGFFWTLVYDTIYAHQDKTDDIKVGVKSTALTFGDNTKTYLAGFAMANIACMTTAGIMADCHGPFYAGLAAAAAHLAWQIWTVHLDVPRECGEKFKSNWWYGLLIFSGIVSDKLLFLT